MVARRLDVLELRVEAVTTLLELDRHNADEHRGKDKPADHERFKGWFESAKNQMKESP